MAETKSRILYILKYLWHNTDAEHYATTGDILTYLTRANESLRFLSGKPYLLSIFLSVWIPFYTKFSEVPQKITGTQKILKFYC